MLMLRSISLKLLVNKNIWQELQLAPGTIKSQSFDSQNFKFLTY